MCRLVFILVLSLLFSAPSFAEDFGSQADHEALRKLKSDATAAVNNRDYQAMRKFLHQPFMSTLITQDSFTDFGKLKDYFENLYTRDSLRLKKVSIGAEADELSQIYQGTFAVTRGSTKERYELADGRNFDVAGRWTAVSIKDKGEWKMLAVHTGTNFLDNPVLNAIEKSVPWIGVGGSAGGLILGLIVGWIARGNRKEKAAA
ncbi:MAG: nuclear transport factor 2 family protein [Rhodocyclales bacterium]|nr:nuclear transport factor 2 family protein [Rhodocyclales bacterium]